MKGLIAVTALMLAGCGGQQDQAPPQTPASYHIGKADLARATPNDICRARDAAFLRNLLLRVTAALPPGTQGFDFADFDARDMAGGKGMEAVLRFHSAGPDGHAQMMYAAGPFDPATCTVGPMAGGTGGGPHAAGAAETFHIAGNGGG
ncbi:hypothetical protein [Novosphingobium naphthalenivorans]|uniref:hypothetical protein n=1 Tax=Novosphingobium naphthalenivorans TaxID=273168 RepID=UPI00083329A6|nr:hypothetical protein [Novosphingobium naphthalenivorans]